MAAAMNSLHIAELLIRSGAVINAQCKVIADLTSMLDTCINAFTLIFAFRYCIFQVAEVTACILSLNDPIVVHEHLLSLCINLVWRHTIA